MHVSSVVQKMSISVVVCPSFTKIVNKYTMTYMYIYIYIIYNSIWKLFPYMYICLQEQYMYSIHVYTWKLSNASLIDGNTIIN